MPSIGLGMFWLVALAVVAGAIYKEINDKEE